MFINTCQQKLIDKLFKMYCFLYRIVIQYNRAREHRKDGMYMMYITDGRTVVKVSMRVLSNLTWTDITEDVLADLLRVEYCGVFMGVCDDLDALADFVCEWEEDTPQQRDATVSMRGALTFLQAHPEEL